MCIRALISNNLIYTFQCEYILGSDMEPSAPVNVMLFPHML